MRTWIGRVVCVLGCLAAGLARAQPDAPARFDEHKVVRVSPRNVRDVQTALALTDDVWTCGYGGDSTTPVASLATFDIRLTPDAFDALKGTDVPFTVMIENLQTLIDAERAAPPFGTRGPDFFAAYHTYAEVNSYIDTLVALRPDLASRQTAGNSLGLNPIVGIRVAGAGVAPGSKPAIVVTGCQHAREWISVMANMYIADQLIRGAGTDAASQRMLANFEFYIFPIVNPDGYLFTWSSNRLWRKNRRSNGDGTIGVDLNRNWGYQWGGNGSSPVTNSETYHGPSAFSEPETAALRDFITARPNMLMAFDLHSYSQIILEPWAYDFALPADTRAFTQISAAIQTAMNAPSGSWYTAGETYRVIYPAAGGAHDWFYGARGALGYSFELRDTGQNGFILPANQIVPASIEALRGIEAAADWCIDNSFAVSFPAGQPTRIAAGSGSTVSVQFARGLKTLNSLASTPPVVFTRAGNAGPFTAQALTLAGTDEGGPVFTHTLPAGACGTLTQWYYQTTAADSSVARSPLGGASAPFQVTAKAATTLLSDDFEIDRGWVVGDSTAGTADNATAGIWTRADPAGTTAQAEYDCTPGGGTLCYITGQNPRGDVNAGRLSSGKTTLTSPTFGAAPTAKVDASFWLWTYTAGSEQFFVDVTATANQITPTWTRILTINPQSAIGRMTGRWTPYTIRLSDFVTPSGSMKLRFIAQDGSFTVYEAALDEVRVVAFTCESSGLCRADYNSDGVLNTQDIFDMLNDWFNANPRANWNGGALDTQDIFEYLNAWFAGCG